MKRSKAVLAVMVALVMTCGIFATAFAKTPVKGNTIVESIFADPMGLCPGWSTDSTTSDIGYLMNDGLLDVDKNFKVYPKMAESYSVSADGLTYTVKLRQGWKFHDGTEVTAEDVAYSFNLILNPKANSPRMGDLDPLKNVEAKDKYTAVFHLKTKDVFFAIGKLTLGYIYPKAALSKYAPEDVKGSDFIQKHPISCGPMKFAEYSQGERIRFTKFDGYFSKFKMPKPCDEYIFLITPNQPTSILKLMNGDANFAQIPANEVSNTKTNKDLTVKPFEGVSYMYLQWNLKKPVFKDVKVRQALTYAVNKVAISKSIYKGYYTPADAWFPPVFPYYNPNIKKYSYDLAKAKKLLDEAGWKMGSNGIREKNGEKMHFVLLALKGNVNREKTCVFLQSSWKQLGVDVEVRALEWNTLNKKYIDTKNFDCAYLSLSHGSIPDPKGVVGPGGYFNSGSYNNAEVNKLCEELPLTVDVNKQNDILKKIQVHVSNDLPFSVILYPSDIYGFAKNVKDLDIKWFGRWMPANWHVSKN